MHERLQASHRLLPKVVSAFDKPPHDHGNGSRNGNA
jgi:hypothetical protein